MTTRVNFEIAKLLTCTNFNPRSVDSGYVISTGEISHDYTVDYINGSAMAAPTIAEVIMWLYDNHDIWITVSHTHLYGFMWEAQGVTNGEYFSPTDCYAAAIEYTLNNIIINNH